MDGMLSKIGEYFFDDDEESKQPPPKHKLRATVMAQHSYSHDDYDESSAPDDDLSSTASATTTSYSQNTGTRRDLSTSSTEYDDDEEEQYKEDENEYIFEEEPSRVIPGTVCTDLSMVSVSERSVISESGTDAEDHTTSESITASIQYTEQSRSRKSRQKHQLGGIPVQLPVHRGIFTPRSLYNRRDDSDSTSEEEESLAGRSFSVSPNPQRRRLHMRLKARSQRASGPRQPQQQKPLLMKLEEDASREETSSSEDDTASGGHKQHIHELMDEISSTSSTESDANNNKKDDGNEATMLPKIHLIQTTQSDVVSVATNGRDFVEVLNHQEDEQGEASSTTKALDASKMLHNSGAMSARVHSWFSKHSIGSEESTEEKIELTIMPTSSLASRSYQEANDSSDEKDGNDDAEKSLKSMNTAELEGAVTSTASNLKEVKLEARQSPTKRAKKSLKSMFKGIKSKIPEHLSRKAPGMQREGPSPDVVSAASRATQERSQSKYSNGQAKLATSINDEEGGVPPPSQVPSSRRVRRDAPDTDECDDATDADQWSQPSTQQVSMPREVDQLKESEGLEDSIPIKKPVASILKHKSQKKMPVRFSKSVVYEKSKKPKRLIQDPFLYHLSVVPSIDSHADSYDSAGMKVSFSEDSSDSSDSAVSHENDRPLREKSGAGAREAQVKVKDAKQEENIGPSERLEAAAKDTASELVQEQVAVDQNTKSAAKKKRFFTSKSNLKKREKFKNLTSSDTQEGGPEAPEESTPKPLKSSEESVDIASRDSAGNDHMSNRRSGSSSEKGSKRSTAKLPTLEAQHPLQSGSTEKSNLEERLHQVNPSIDISDDRRNGKNKWGLLKYKKSLNDSRYSRETSVPSTATKHVSKQERTGGTPRSGETNPHIDVLTGQLRPTQFFDDSSPHQPALRVFSNHEPALRVFNNHEPTLYGTRPKQAKPTQGLNIPMCIRPQASMESHEQSYYSYDARSPSPTREKMDASNYSRVQPDSPNTRWKNAPMAPVQDLDEGEDQVEVHVMNPPVCNRRKGALEKLKSGVRGMLKKNHHRNVVITTTGGDASGSYDAHSRDQMASDHDAANSGAKQSGSCASTHKTTRTNLQRVLSERRRMKEMMDSDDLTNSVVENSLRTMSYSTVDAVDLADTGIRNQRVLETLKSVHALTKRQKKHDKSSRNRHMWISHLDNCAEGVMDPIIDEIEDVACGPL